MFFNYHPFYKTYNSSFICIPIIIKLIEKYNLFTLSIYNYNLFTKSIKYLN